MSVKYNTRVIEFSTSGAANYYAMTDRIEFMQHLMAVISELSGVQLAMHSSSANPTTSAADTYITVKDTVFNNPIMYIRMPNTSSSNCGYVSFGNMYSNAPGKWRAKDQPSYCYYNCRVDKSIMRLHMHYLKAGDLFVFGFAPASPTAGYYGWMNMALAPVRSYSNPSKIVGYTFVQVAHNNYADASKQTAILHSQFYDPLKEDLMEYSVAWTPFNSRYLTTGRSSTVALIPLMMGCADYYIDGVYIANKYGSIGTEKAVQLDIGTFILANTYGVNSDKKWANALFDISVIADEVITDDL